MEANCIYVGANGKSKIGRVNLPMMHKATADDGSSVWSNVQTGKIWGVTGGEGHLPTDDFGPWHTANPMMSIVLKGAWEVQVGSGEQRVLELGSLTVFLDDTGQGHRSRTVSTEPSVVIGIGLDEKSTLDFKTQLGIA